VNTGQETKKKKFFDIAIPHTYVIIFAVIILATIATWILPAGMYERIKDPNTGRTIVNVTSFHYVTPTPVSLFDMFKAIPIGMQQAANIVFFAFIIGGTFTMIQATGVFDGAISRAIIAVKGREKITIPIVMFLFSIMGFSFGAAEEVIPFVPLTIFLARGLGYDDIVGVALVSTGACVGFAGGMMNPFTTAIAQGIAQLPLYSGMGFRTVGYIIFYVISVWYVMRYAAIIKADATKSLLYDPLKVKSDTAQTYILPEFNAKHKLILAIVVIAFAYMVYGVIQLKWYLTEMAALFVLLSIVTCFIAGMKANEMAKVFVKGAQNIVVGALVIGIARAILVVMTQGKIIDTVIAGLAQGVSQLPVEATAVAMFWGQSVLNFFIPSGSGQAATTMPIMAPLADVIGITRQTAVLAFQYGDAFSNQIIPTSGALLGVLSLGNVPYDKWLKFAWPMVAYWSIAGTVLVWIAAVMKYGPF
jgi:uncharacterized ion transporter superfamily protein YfcC